jgi:hypothetical protein
MIIALLLPNQDYYSMLDMISVGKNHYHQLGLILLDG